MKYIKVDKLKSILGIEKCEECKFGGSYCADCDPLYFDAHYVINKINELIESSDEEKGLIEFDMRSATEEEKNSVDRYIQGIFEYTGVNIFDV